MAAPNPVFPEENANPVRFEVPAEVARDTEPLARAAAGMLADAMVEATALHLPGARDRHRRQLERAIDLANRVLEENAEDAEAMASARSTLVTAHAARARDACHGAGQLSRGSQRAPTRDDCEDGWQRVEAIVTVAEASALEAARMAAALDDSTAWKSARAAEAAARDARRIVDERNHGYTFHTDPGFSFGEGWYVAAAGLLAGVAIQIEPDKPQTTQAVRFLHDAGLDPRLQPYRSRPRANKHLPEIVARAFRADPSAAQRQLCAAFLGDAPISRDIIDWADRRLGTISAGPKVLLWLRYGAHHPTRNTTYPELAELARRALAEGLVPILVGDALRDGPLPSGALDMTLFWKEPIFQGEDMRRAQLQVIEHLKHAHGVVGQLGVTTAGMDGPALLGLPTMYLTDAPNVRLGKWVGMVPGYEEVVREHGDGYLDRVGDRLRRWADAG